MILNREHRRQVNLLSISMNPVEVASALPIGSSPLQHFEISRLADYERVSKGFTAWIELFKAASSFYDKFSMTMNFN